MPGPVRESPTDRPDRIARAFVDAGAPVIHLVDLDGARAGQPASLASVAEVARAVAVPLQVAGGVDGPDQIELCFAAGATRVVVPLWAVVEDRARLDACLCGRRGLAGRGPGRAAGATAGLSLEALPATHPR